MRWLTNLLFRLRAVFAPGRMERELDDELAFHVEMETGKLERGGLAPAAAAREARRRFGGVVRQRERAREAWGIAAVRDLQADMRHTLRQFRKHPGFSGVTVLTLALGIGATVALYSVVQGVMLRPLPVLDERRLVVFWSEFNWRGVEFDFVRERVRAYRGVAAYTLDATPMRDQGGGTALLWNALGSAELFEVLGVAPLLGRSFAPGEDRPGAEPVVVIGHGVWQQELGGDPGVVGTRITLGGEPTTVIGVMPEGFYFPTPDFRAWRPLLLDPATQRYQGSGYLTLVARVRDDFAPAAVDDDVQQLAAALGERFTYPDAWDKTRGAYVTPLRESLLGDVRPALLLLLGAVVLLLLMACANAAALTLARTTDRTGEMAVRAALGAGRGRLARQVFAESVALSLIAAALGAGLAVALFDALVASLPLGDGFGTALSLHWDTFAAAFGLALLVGCAVAAVPMRHLLRGGLEDLRSERAETARVRTTGRAHGVLVAAEVLLAVTLVAGAALLIRSVSQLQAVDLGLTPEGVITLDLVAGEDEMSEVERRAFFAEVDRRAAALPGVTAAGLVNRLPIRDGGWQGTVVVEDRPDLAGAAAPNSYWRAATPNYFRALGIAITRGRGFDERDRGDAPPVTIVSEAFAAQMWPGEDPIGKRVRPTIAPDSGWVTVVGVAEEARVFGITGANPLVTYAPLAQAPMAGIAQVLVLRAERRAATALLPAARRMVRELDGRVAVARAGAMTDVVATAMAESLRLRLFLTLFAALGLLLGAVGVYGVVSYAVARRRAEFGIRMALGATAGNVLSDVVRRGMMPVALGVAGGVALTLGLSRAVGGFLYEVAATDPASLAVAALVLLATGIAAAAIPALRAGRVNPVEALRTE